MHKTTKKNIHQSEFADLEKFRIKMQREHILKRLKDQGYRVTKQRIAVIDIILEHECGSCKEIMYQISKTHKNIGAATIYRTLNMLEEIGAINQRSRYQFSGIDTDENGVLIMLENGKKIYLNTEEWNNVMQKGMETCGYLKHEKINSIIKNG